MNQVKMSSLFCVCDNRVIPNGNVIIKCNRKRKGKLFRKLKSNAESSFKVICKM